MTRRRKIESPPRIHRAKISAIETDEEFESLVPQPLPHEREEHLNGIFQEGCGSPLVVWKWNGRLILLVGYSVFPVLRDHRMTFPIIEKDFASRAEARQYIVQHFLRTGLLTPVAFSYFRGQRCSDLKLPRGGDRKSRDFRKSFGKQLTLAALAEMYQVSRSTIRDEVKFAKAVDALIAHSGPWLRPLILSRGATVRRAQVMALASRKPKEQVTLLKHLRVTGRLPRGWNRNHEPTMSVPREPKALVQTMIDRLGKAELAQVARLLRSRESNEQKSVL